MPIPWKPDGPSYGFGSGGSWLPQPEKYGELSAQNQEADPDSMLALYRAAIAIRKEYLTKDESFEMVELGKSTLAFSRGDLLVVVNMGKSDVKLPDGEILIQSTQVAGTLRPNSAAWLRVG